MYVELGKIVGVWGVKGWVKLHSYTRQRGDIADYKHWFLQSSKSPAGQPRAVEILNCREQGPGVVAQIKGVDDRGQAMLLSGQSIMVKKTDLPALAEGEFYWQQLIGLLVLNADASDQGRAQIGTVDSILETGANDVLVIKGDKAGGADVLIPYTKEVVKEIDIEQGTMLVDWDPSFLLD